jgi:drug/metabolite transporter (DMT)-like permease
MERTKTILAHLALLGVQLLYAGNYTISKEVMPTYVAPLGLVMMRMFFGVLAFWMLHWFFIKAEKVEKKDLLRLFACGVFGIAINQVAFFHGLNLTTPINASIIMLIVPILIFIGSVLFLKEKFTKINILGIVLGCVGAGLIISAGQRISFNKEGLTGDLFILLNASSYSVYLVIVRPLIQKYHPIVVIKWVFTFGTFVATPFILPELLKTDWEAITPPIWGSIIYILVGVTLLTYLFNGFALKILSSRVVGAYIYMQPILAAIIALLAGSDSLTTMKIAAGVLIFLGVFLASQRKAAND